MTSGRMIVRSSPAFTAAVARVRLAQPLAHDGQPGDVVLVANRLTARNTTVTAAPSAITDTVRSCRKMLTRSLPT